MTAATSSPPAPPLNLHIVPNVKSSTPDVTNNNDDNNVVRVDKCKFSAFLDGKHAPFMNTVRSILADNEWEHLFDADTLPYHDERLLVMKWAKLLSSQLISRANFDLLHVLRHDYQRYVMLMEAMSLLNSNLVIKTAVQYSLFCGTVANLGTEKHHDLVRKGQTLEVLGCFGMTEKGHGSNVRGIETTATYDSKNRQFIIHTPNRMAMKTWIGGSGLGHMCCVFAHLIIEGKQHGVHVFLVPLRDAKTGKLMNGVYMEDCEYKMGLNGIDNFSFGFNQVRIPRDNMLNRFSEVMEDGRYVNRCGTESRHFGMTVGELSGGRLAIAAVGLTTCKMGLTIAIRYAFERRQFGAPNSSSEVAIMSYPTHKRRLMPLLARTVALVPFYHYAVDVYGQKDIDPSTVALGHNLTSIIKVVSSWHMVNLLDECRQCCGGAGFRAPNRISSLIRDTHIFVTFEGDNTVLTQQTAKYLLVLYANAMKNGGKFSGILSHLNQAPPDCDGGSLSVDEQLLCPKYQLYLFQQREISLLRLLAHNLQKRQQSGQNEWEAFNEELVLARDLALAHAERLIQEHMVKSYQICSFANSGILRLLTRLNALAQIQKDLGWFVTNDILAPAVAKRVEPLVMGLCNETVKHSLAICDSFQIAPKFLPPSDLSDYVLPSNTMFYNGSK